MTQRPTKTSWRSSAAQPVQGGWSSLLRLAARGAASAWAARGTGRGRQVRSQPGPAIHAPLHALIVSDTWSPR
ncbi:hypothetical protein [Caldimonas sp. KR1-144]|uniref:hypothetical protein n=1 Tax=Caldimonas sp. KR1-144 TaxID=3400911 RepID=UPI003BFB7912